jgi:hypothetical protein
VSTITGIRGRRVVDGDGVLQMLLWLERTPESFMPGYQRADDEVPALPRPGRDRILRWNACGLYEALDARRRDRSLTWKQVASEIGGCAPASLTRLSHGGRVGVPAVMRILRWLDQPAASFTHITSA